ncbi:hypothetical protein [Bosea sp. PAMC 26642]|uniref:hypothetical protein n=1 Tax=Bosea sp. (strain PAMC 26642) TaxID=1792307 RepID=UPI0007703F69|nr:hypothetical protein [Bosea sp. PAMC 26642]AMJ63044.1 hypothetical protein AXW83_24535 [Bosea sp. PAMC 26642]
MAIFQPRPFQMPNLRTDYRAENSAFANLGQTLGDLIPDMRKQDEETRKRDEELRKREERARIGKGIADGTLDHTKAAGGLATLGDMGNAIELLRMGEAAKTRTLGQEATRGLFGVLGGGGLLGSDASAPAPSTGSGPASLIQNESGGRWNAENNAVGAGGQRGHFGRIQFGQARLQEAQDAGAIPPGTTPRAFMASPELQQSAERWHWNDIDLTIKANGYDRLVGQPINGVPVTIDGLRAVAHLGGKEGMRKFVESGGAYNARDENGTSLMDYFSRHGGQRSRVAQGDPDMPAAGATPALMDGGQSGFAVPGSPPMDGRTFNGIQDGQRLDPTFQSEGATQPWMNTALGKPRVPDSASNDPMPPSRPYDLGADLPARGAVPAIGQMPNAGPAQPDYSNANDAGARQLLVQSEEQRRGQSPAPASGVFAMTPGAERSGRALEQAPQNPAASRPAQPSFADRPAMGATPAQGQGYAPQGAPPPVAPAPAQPVAPVPSAEMPRPTNREEAKEYHATRQMEAAKGKANQIATALANPNLPANARAVGEIFLKEALEASKVPDSVKEYLYAKSMGWTTAKGPNEYAREKTKTTPAEEVEGRKGGAAAAGLKPGDAGYQGYVLTGKMPREDMGPLTATDKKAILDADEGVLAANTAIDALKTAKKLSPQALGGWGASGKASVANNLPDWMVPDRLIGSPQQGESTAELENVVTSQALAQLKSIFGSAPTEGERKILLDIQGSIGQPDNVRQKIYDRGIAMAEKRLGFSQQRADELRGGGFYKPGSGQGRQQGGMTQPAPQQAQPQAQQPQQRQTVAAPAQAIEFLRANPGARQEFDAKYGQGASASVLGR